MTPAEQTAIYHRARQLGTLIAHAVHTRDDAARSAYYLSHSLAHGVPTQTQQQLLTFLESI